MYLFIKFICLFIEQGVINKLPKNKPTKIQKDEVRCISKNGKKLKYTIS